MGPETVLVIGATGQQGGATARALVSDGRKVRALVRDAGTEPARVLIKQGVELVVGDLGDAASLDRAVRDVDGVFAALPSSAERQYGLSDADEVRFGFVMVDAAKRGGVRHLVYSSTIGASPNLGLGHYASKWEIERHLRGSGVPFTIVRPAPFMELLLYPHFGLADGVVTFFSAPDQPVQFIAVEDVGVLSAGVLADPSGPAGVTLDLAGDTRTGNELAAQISQAVGRELPYAPVPAAAAADSPMLAGLLAAMANGKLDGHADLSALRALHPGLMSFADWLAAGHAAKIAAMLPATNDQGGANR